MFHTPKRAFRVSAVLLAGMLAVSMIGCGGSATPKKQAKRAKKPATVASAKLPKLDNYLPPVDEGRLEAAPPQGWYVPPRSSKYLFRVQKSDSESYPCVLATAEDFDQFSYLTEENVNQFARQRAAELKKKPDQVKPVKIGDFLGITYAKRAKVKGTVSQIVELQYLETVIDGRLYRIELRAESGTLTKVQPYLYAVAKGLRFPKAQRPAPQQIAQADDSTPAAAAPAKAEKKAPAAEQAAAQASGASAKAEASEEKKPEKKPEAEKKPKKKPEKKAKKKDSGLDLDELEELLGDQ